MDITYEVQSGFGSQLQNKVCQRNTGILNFCMFYNIWERRKICCHFSKTLRQGKEKKQEPFQPWVTANAADIVLWCAAKGETQTSTLHCEQR